MQLDDFRHLLGEEDPGAQMHALVRRLYPLCRSITGDGVRETLAVLRELVPVESHEVPSGTPVLDWVVPKEWNIRDAYVKDARGERVIDFKKSNLHVVGYSVPVPARTMTLAELRPKLHTLPERPDWVPYRNSFYRDDWGFCLTHRQLEALADGSYEVCIDSTLAPGSLTYGELLLPGASADEVLLSAHVCHPSLANDNLSGIAVAVSIARYLAARIRAGRPPRYSYRFLFAPTTIGSITWLARNEERLGRIRHGLVLTLLGDPGALTYKRSRRGDALVDRAATTVLQHAGSAHRVQDFLPFGYDERQFCSPGFDLAVGCLMRTPYAQFPEYHNSGDNPDFVRAECLADSLRVCLGVLDVLEQDGRFLNLNPKGEPQLGRRGIYRALADRSDKGGSIELAMLWVLNQSDGGHSLLDIAQRSGLSFAIIAAAAATLSEHQLLRRLEDEAPAPGAAPP
jgi:aminopeptidase-like protein